MKGVSAYRLTNVSRNSRTFPHSITNKEGGNGKNSKFGVKKKGLGITCSGKRYRVKEPQLIIK